MSGTFGTLAASVSNGSSERVALVIDNSATATSKINGATAVQVYAIPQGGLFSPGAADTTLLTTVHPVLHIRPGGTQKISLTVPITSALAAGSYQLAAVIGSGHGAGASNASSNVAFSAPFTVTQRNFDLASSISVTRLPTVIAGTPTNAVARVTVTNTAVSTAAVPAGVRIPIQVIARPVGATGTSGDVIVGATTLPVGNLRPGASRTISVPLSFPATLSAGGFNLIASANGNGTVAEANSLNDQSTLVQTLTVLPAGTPVTSTVPGLTTQPVSLTTRPVTPLSTQPVTPIVAQPVTIITQPVTSTVTLPANNNLGFTPPTPTVDFANTPTFAGTTTFPTLATSPALTPSPTLTTLPTLNSSPTLVGVTFPSQSFQVANSATGISGLSPTNLNLFPTSTAPLTLGGTTGNELSLTSAPATPSSILLMNPNSV